MRKTFVRWLSTPLCAVSLVWAAGAAAQTAPASSTAPAAKPSTPSGQVYRCGNQYVEKPCADGSGKAVQIINNSSTGSNKPAAPVPASAPPAVTAIPGDGPRPSAEECKKMREPLARQSQPASRAANQAIADLAAKIETAGC